MYTPVRATTQLSDLDARRSGHVHYGCLREPGRRGPSDWSQGGTGVLRVAAVHPEERHAAQAARRVPAERGHPGAQSARPRADWRVRSDGGAAIANALRADALVLSREPSGDRGRSRARRGIHARRGSLPERPGDRPGLPPAGAFPPDRLPQCPARGSARGDGGQGPATVRAADLREPQRARASRQGAHVHGHGRGRHLPEG